MIVVVLNNNLIIIQRAIQAIKSKVIHRRNIIFSLLNFIVCLNLQALRGS